MGKIVTLKQHKDTTAIIFEGNTNATNFVWGLGDTVFRDLAYIEILKRK